jgi:hypothetical protein
MLEKIEDAIKNGQSREIGNLGHTRQRKTKQKHKNMLKSSKSVFFLLNLKRI